MTGLGYAFTNKTLSAFVARLSVSFSLSFTKHIWVLNKDDEKTLKRYIPLAARRIFLLPGEGVNTEKFSPRPRDPNAPFTFFMNARLLRDKGVGEYDAAARILRQKYPDIRFNLIGHVDKENPAAFTQQELDLILKGDGMTYLGTTNDVPLVTSDCDAVVLSSYREGVPVALLEGAAMAKPMIATDVPGCRDVLNDGVNGLSCTPRDISSLVAACEKMIQMPKEDREKMGGAARKMIMDIFDETHIFAAYDDMIERTAR